MVMVRRATESLRVWLKKVFRKVAVYFSANLVAQLITLLSYPLITRVYAPAELGLASPIVMGLAMFMSFSSLNLPYYAMTLNSRQERTAAFSASLYVTLAMLPLILLLSVGYFVSVEHYQVDLAWLTVMVALAFVGSSVLLTTERYLQYHSRFNVVSLSLVLAAITGVIAKLVFAYMGMGYWGLLNAFVLGLLVQITVCAAAGVSKQDFRDIFAHLPISKFKTFVAQTQFTFYRTSQAFVWFVATVAISSIILVLYGESEAGVFSLAWLMSSAVANILGKALFDVYFSNASKLSTSEFVEHSKKYWSNIAKIIPALFLISPLAYYIAGPMFAAVFGQEWVDSGYIGVMLLCSFGFGSVLAPVFIAYIRWNKQHIQLLFSLLTFILPLGAIFFCHQLGLSMSLAIFSYGLVNIALLCFSAWYCYRLVFQPKHGEAHCVTS